MSRVTLRPVEVTDFDAIFELMRDPASIVMAAFTAQDPSNRAAFDLHMAAIMSSRENRFRCIMRDSKLVGTVASYVADAVSEVTYWIDRALGTRHRHERPEAAPR